MKNRIFRVGRVMAVITMMTGAGPATASSTALDYHQQQLQINGHSYEVRIPNGYQLELLTSELDGPRMLRFRSNGDLFIGSKSRHVYRLQPPYTRVSVLVRLTDYPHSVAFRRGEILIAQHTGLYRADYRDGQAKIDPEDVSLLAPLPAGRGHNSRTVAIGPDGRVYVSLGFSGNCSDEYLGPGYEFERRRGGLLVLDETASPATWQVFASGLRNPVGFAWQPRTGIMYATNNGPDHLGFDKPAEYFSRIDAGSFHGMPWFQYDGEQLVRDDCISSRPPRPITDVTLPAAVFPARNAPLAVDFVPDGAMDPRLTGDAIVALHGSWATRPYGKFLGDQSSRRAPAVVAVRFEKGSAVRVDPLISGFQSADGERLARPVGVAIGPDGDLYFTSDSGINGLFRLHRVADR